MSVLIVAVTNFVDSNPRAVAKNYTLNVVQSQILPVKNATIVLPSPLVCWPQNGAHTF